MQKQRVFSIVGCLTSAACLVMYSQIRKQLPSWWAASSGGILYVVFWILFVYSIWPRPLLRKRICAGVVLTTCLLEILQLWKPAFLTTFRATKFGAALIGTSFAWNDFPPYFLGGFFGLIVLWLLQKFNNDSAAVES